MTPEIKRLRADTDEALALARNPRSAFYRARADAALAAERAAWEAEIKRLSATLEMAKTIIEIEERHERDHYDDHEDHTRGERYEDCSACRWVNVHRAIQAALREETP